MSTSAYTRIPVIIFAALALAACPWKKEKKQEEGQHDDERPSIFYVSASTGSNTNPGTQNSPFKTITRAMSVATRSGSTVHVLPGTYDTPNNNEAFPITVPTGVLLIGDETNRGTTSIVGGGLAPGSTPGDVSVGVLPGMGSTIAGFTITNDASAFAARRGLMLGYSTVTLRNNTVTGATHAVGIYVDASTNHVITRNWIVDNGAGSGLAFVKGGVGSKVENNVITGNGVGVEYDVAGGDLGSTRAGGSAGGNVLSCNTQSDLKAAAPTAIAISAIGNFWDRSPPMFGCNAGDDICMGTATVDASNPKQASNPCIPAASPIFFVNVSSVGPDAGSDLNPGTRALPFKTITHAMTLATSGSTVQVFPGIYDTLNNGETFPITVPAGVLLISDEPETNQGSGTSIVGGGQVPTFPAGTSAAVHPGTGSTIAGFTITNDNLDPALARYGLFLSHSAVTLRNNTVTGASHVIGVYVADDGGTPPKPSENHVITLNRIVGNGPPSGMGLGFISGGRLSKVENNVITGNGVGVEYDVDGGDLGGGSKGSIGRNVISCNANDLVAAVAAPQTPITISAANNFWDHATPTVGCNPGNDICDFGTLSALYVVATINTLPAAQTTSTIPCSP